MNNPTEDELEQLQDKSFKNKSWLMECGYYGCFCCLKWGNVKEVEEFVDRGQTGICPHCGIDSLIAFKLEEHEVFQPIMKNMQERFFKKIRGIKNDN